MAAEHSGPESRYAPMMSVHTTQHHSLIDCTVSPIIPMEGFLFKHNSSKVGWCFALIAFQSGGVELYAQHRFLCFRRNLPTGGGAFLRPAGPSVGNIRADLHHVCCAAKGKGPERKEPGEGNAAHNDNDRKEACDMKKLVTLFLALALCMGLAVPAFAASTETIDGVTITNVVRKETKTVPFIEYDENYNQSIVRRPSPSITSLTAPSSPPMMGLPETMAIRCSMGLTSKELVVRSERQGHGRSTSPIPGLTSMN